MNKFLVLALVLTLYSCIPDCKDPVRKHFVVYYPDYTDTISVTGCNIYLRSYSGTNKLSKTDGKYIQILSTTAPIREINKEE